MQAVQDVGTRPAMSFHQVIARIKAETHSISKLALAAAELDDGAGQGKRAAKALNVSEGSLTRARAILKTQDIALIEKVRRGDVTLFAAYRDLGYSTTRGRSSVRNKDGSVIDIRGGASVSASRVGMEMYQQLKTALESLSGMPAPADVAEILKRYNASGSVTRNVARVAQWLKDLHDAINI